MTSQDRPALRLVGGSAPEDAVVRRKRFEQAHPEAVILPPSAGRWRAVAAGRTLGAWDLCGPISSLTVDETPSSNPGTLVSGYEFVRDAEPQLGRGGLYKRVSDAGAIPVGPAHAVESGERLSICGRTMRTTTGPWPPGMGDLCPDCREAAPRVT